MDCETITHKAAVNMFEGMEIAESIDEDVVELFDEKHTRVYDNHAGISRKMRGEAAL